MEKKVMFILIVLMTVLNVHTKPQHTDYDEDVEDQQDDNIENKAVAEVVSPYCAQCMYDYKGNRVNKGCSSEKPPKCDKGTVVSTAVGEDFEMCCCNYTNYL